MPASVVMNTVRERIEQNWNVANGYIIGSFGVTTPPADGRGFILIHYPVVEGRRPVLSKRRFEEGAARIIWNVPSSIAAEASVPIAETISALFRGDNLKINGVEFLEPSNPIINDDNDDGNYYELSVVVPYRYQFDVA